MHRKQEKTSSTDEVMLLELGNRADCQTMGHTKA
jgi:hypothetical protein